ncbi:cytosolic phospholipase A2 gamma isoform X28 [Pan paniscus]|uniref:cytosolic phospholipase A2 gamma isoform X28 n=1 Tax=Pan paniscus TaxID=9597 RepID=UPI0015618A8D|nr:cytosolic phospholipase A2 gamma isoform X20 [Pan paniscus]XP_054529646.1 cytosolic phospholipase A2 gamma isoform X27 [Pan troglodytes]
MRTRPRPRLRRTENFLTAVHHGKKEEKAAVERRRLHVLKALKKLRIEADEAPVVAVLGSGGGLRAHIACLGVLSEMKEQGLLDAVTYLAGVSGSTWAISSLYTNDGDMEALEADLKHRFTRQEWDLAKSLQKTIQAARSENYSLTDFWAYMVISKQTRELPESHLSNMKKPVEEGTLPYPIFAAIDNDLQPSWQEARAPETWFEFTPHHAGFPALGAFVSITHFGSKFKKGRLVRTHPERDLTFLRGLWGSALGNTEVIREYIFDQLRNLTLKGLWRRAVANAKSIGHLLFARLLRLQESSQGEHPPPEDEGGEPEHTWLTEMLENWTRTSLEKQEQPHEDPERKGSLSNFMDFVKKTGICASKWEWGTTHNFLYKHSGIRDKIMSSRKHLHLVDAGLAINTPFPLVLPPTREVHLILSFDFSAGDPFETIRATTDYCRRHKIPFPQVEEAELDLWSKAPASCYILKGETGPVVMHFPLFNIDACGGDIEAWSDTYDTFKLADTYTLDVVVLLLALAKKNVRENKKKILRELMNVAGLYYPKDSARSCCLA